MKHSVLLGLAVGMTLAFASCSQPTSSSSSGSTSTVYKNSVLPNTSTVKLPTSLTTSSTTASLAAARATTTTTGTQQSEGYAQIKDMTNMMSQYDVPDSTDAFDVRIDR